MIIKVATLKAPRNSPGYKDTFHLSTAGQGRTWCGRDCSEWMNMGEVEDHELASAYLCTRCSAAAHKESGK